MPKVLSRYLLLKIFSHTEEHIIIYIYDAARAAPLREIDIFMIYAQQAKRYFWDMRDMRDIAAFRHAAFAYAAMIFMR